MLTQGFEARPLALVDGDGDDVDRAAGVVLAHHSSILEAPDDTRESVRWDLISVDAVVDEHRIVLDSNNNAVGLLVVEREPDIDRVFFDVYSVPSVATVVLPLLIDLGIQAATRVSDGQPGWEVGSAGYVNDSVLMNALEAAGFAAVRRYWRMRVHVDNYPTVEPPAPEGVSRTVVSGENERRLLHSVHESAFANHFGSASYRYEDWFTFFDERSDARPDLRWLAWLNGEVVAECTADDSRASLGHTYVRTLGVLPQARGRGIGRWLLQCQFAQAAREGRTQVALTVDSENSTGATRLYESVGMQPHDVIDLMRRPLA